MAKLIGTDPNQVPTNADLGTMAYQDSGNVKVGSFTSNGIEDNATSTAMTLDSSGNLLVGKTSADGGVAGFEARSTGETFATSSGATLYAKRTTGDGDIIVVQNSSGTVGSIGVTGGFLTIGESTTALKFADTFNIIHTVNMSNGADVDGVVDLGYSGARFKDLYLSGGVVFGTTGGSVTSKTLDDYEEGTWTIAFGGGTVTPTNSTGYYTKIGNRVFIQYYSGSTTITGASGSAFFSGLPFSVATGSYTYQPFYTTHNTFFGGSTSVGIDGYFAQGTSQASFMELGSTSAVSLTNGSDLYIMIAGSYYAA
jgi:hypothetical protein